MRGVCCTTLASISGRGVSELDVVGDVIGGEYRLAATVRTAQRHAPVGVGGGHQPAVAVLNPGPAGRDEPVVLTGDDLVTYSCCLAVSYQQPLFGDRPLPHPIGSGPDVELGDSGRVPGDHQARLAGIDVFLPGGVDGIEQDLPGAFCDAAMSLVVIDGGLVAEAQLDARGLLPLRGKATEIGRLGNEITAVFDKQREGSARLHRAELCPGSS